MGAGIGSLAAGADTDDALKAALLGGIGGYAASGSMFTPTAATAPSAAAASGTQAVTSSVTGNPVGGTVGAGPFPAVTSAPDPTFFQKAVDFAKTPTGMATIGGIGGLAALSGPEMQETFTPRPDPKGESRLGLGFIGDKSYDLDDDEDRKKYFADLAKRKGIMSAAAGGEVEGPGTGTSDSVPARLSDGEFVLLSLIHI